MIRLLISSVGIKAASAVLELVIQLLITRAIGVTGYGNYSFYVNAIEIAYWLLFSGLVKCNTFYLADNGVSIARFKRKYYCRYMLPVLAVFCVLSIVSRQWMYLLSAGALVLYFFAFDQSSEFLARGRGMTFLAGEYLVGRVVFILLLSVFLALRLEQLGWLLFLYGLQYGVVLLWFRLHRKKIALPNRREEPVSLGKLWQYQQSDMAYGLIGQAPVILQYLFVGAYETGFVGIVIVVKKLVNFISGPTAKIFLPEFSRLYRQNKVEEIRRFFRTIIQIQMLFVSAVAVALLGFSELVLRLFSPELLDQAPLFRMVAAGFLLVASLGPGAGLMQMTGQEKLENRMRWGTIALMFLIWFVMRGNRFFALYGLCAQAIAEGVFKYFLVCRWFKKAPISIFQYCLLWLPAAAVCLTVRLLNLGDSFPALVLSCGACIALTGGILLIRRDVRLRVRAALRKWRGEGKRK